MSERSSWAERHKHTWTRSLEHVYDEVTEHVEKELKSREEAHQKELKKQDDEKQILSAHINQLVIKNGGLVLENNDLKYQLKRLESKVSGNVQQPSSTTLSISRAANDLQQDQVADNASISSKEYRHLVDKFNALNEIHQEVVQKAKYLEKKNAAVMQKNREMKDNVKAWQEYSDRQRKKRELKSEAKRATETSILAATGGKDSSPFLSSPRIAAVRTPLSLVGLEKSSPTPMLPLTENDSAPHVQHEHAPEIPARHDHAGGRDNQVQRECSDDLPTTHVVEPVAAHQGSLLNQVGFTTDPEAVSAEKVTSSQTTEDDAVTQAALIPTEGSTAVLDETPQVVSSRILKRKRARPSKFNIHSDRVPSDGTPTNPFRVKEEQFSSPPALTEVQQLLRKETLDLDELGSNMVRTPQRRRRDPPSMHSARIATLQNQRCVSVPLIKEEHANEGDYPRVDMEISLVDTIEADQAEALLEARAFSEPVNKIPGLRGPLQPINPNIQTPESAEEEPLFKRLRRDQDQEQFKYQLLTESGDAMPPMHEYSRRLDPNSARDNFNRKLQAAKCTPVSAKPVQGTASSNTKSTGQLPTPPSTNVRSKDTPSSRPGLRKEQPTASWPKPKASASSDTVSSLRRRAKEPLLRTKRPSELKISDFRANPAYNGGYSYAFTETVRKRADRACLPGCTRPECCGSTFRTLALTAAPLSSSQEEELLEDYLGDAYDTMHLTQMSSNERRELVLQARTRELATKHGRHRQAYERHTTPPGFWRVDFPTTQETEEDRQKAEQMERKMVEDRWIEAMRKNGKWIFRDE
ncbi:DNA repair protein endonuclease SAE2/CtIP C-terminus-domain-containing protein [Lophiotrema nucula]|uniref:DNA repair protein endonuclease SAE2/CtIP C-terminus-domain-containing protein n=1 Tax=Lophiotrema nucula TaxID=690887 RepID=A0A6A5ZJD8_9PLEO|nr:DNA repair protein endonuclease SAE2/CtIP C-terminus-domain-containing protein [Lophiotrema nucula]